MLAASTLLAAAFWTLWKSLIAQAANPVDRTDLKNTSIAAFNKLGNFRSQTGKETKL